MNKIGILLITIGILSSIYNCVILINKNRKISKISPNEISTITYTNLILSVIITIIGFLMITSILDTCDDVDTEPVFGFG